MNFDELIATEEICTHYKVERSFISSLDESGLIEVVTIEEKKYIHSDHLSQFEKLMRLHRDLSINVEGLEAVQHLLEQVRRLQKINQQLRNRLSLYET